MDEETVFNGWVIFNLLDDIDIGPKPDPVDFYYVIISKKKKKTKMKLWKDPHFKP